jgi:hypothetical protein
MTQQLMGLTRVMLEASFAVLMTAAAALAGANPLVGTWHLNLAKSKLRNSPAPKSLVARVVPMGGGISVALSAVDAGGKKGQLGYTANYDGKDYPIAGSRLFSTVALKRLDDHTDEAIYKKKGKLVQTSRRTVSKDGRLLTITDDDPSHKSAPIVTVWDRQ